MKIKIFLLLVMVGIFWGASGQEKNYIRIELCKPTATGVIFADLIVEDQYGRKTGYDIITEKEYNEIPGAIYYDEDYSDDLSNGPPLFYNIFLLEPAFASEYKIWVIGGVRTSYNLTIYTSCTGCEEKSFHFSDYVDRGQLKQYKLVYTPDPSVPITVEEVKELDPLSTIGEMIAFIDTAYAHKKIDPRGIATSIISKLEVAKEELEKEKPKQALNALNAFLNELETQHEKHIADEVYVYLKEKVKRLIAQIESSG